MGLGDGGTDRQSESGAALLGGKKRVEHALQNPRRDTAPSVHHGDSSMVGPDGSLYPHHAARRRCLVRVHQKIQEQLLELRMIAQDQARRWARRRGDDDVLLRERRPHGFDRFGDRCP